MDGAWRKKYICGLLISCLRMFWWEPDFCTQMDFTRLWRHWDDMPSSSVGTQKSSASADVSTACRTTYWLNLACHGMAWHSCNVILGFIVNAFISVYRHLSKHNKRAELKLNGRSARLLRAYWFTMPCSCCRLMKNWCQFELAAAEAYCAFCARVFYRPLGVHPIIWFARGRVSLGFRAGKQAELFPILSYLQSGYIHQNWLERQRIRGCKIGH